MRNLNFNSVQSFAELRGHIPHGGMFAVKGKPHTFLAYAEERLRGYGSRLTKRALFTRPKDQEIHPDSATSYVGILDTVECIGKASAQSATTNHNTEVEGFGYRPLEAFGSLHLTNTPYANIEQYHQHKNSEEHIAAIEDALHHSGQLPEGESLLPGNRDLYGQVMRHGVNIGQPGYINHPDSGLQAGAFINDENKTVIIAFSGINGDKADAKEAFVHAGRNQYAAARDEVHALLESGHIPDGYKVVLAGHSLGTTLTQRIIHDALSNNKYPGRDISALNFEALQIAGDIDNYDPDAVPPHKCVNFNSVAGFSNYKVGKYGGGHVGGGYLKVPENAGRASDIVPEKVAGTGVVTKIPYAGRHFFNHWVGSVAEGVLREHVANDAPLEFVSTASPVKEQQPAAEQRPIPVNALEV